MTLWDETGAMKKKTTREHMAREKATVRQWEYIDLAIKAFSVRYPVAWNAFKLDQIMRKNNADYYTAKEGDLKKSNYRLTASFPVVLAHHPVTGEEYVADSLYPVLEKIIPGLTKNGSKNFIPFLQRYPIFNPGSKLGASE